MLNQDIILAIFCPVLVSFAWWIKNSHLILWCSYCYQIPLMPHTTKLFTRKLANGIVTVDITLFPYTYMQLYISCNLYGFITTCYMYTGHDACYWSLQFMQLCNIPLMTMLTWLYETYFCFVR